MGPEKTSRGRLLQSWLALQRLQLEGGHRLLEAAQRERPERLDLGEVRDLALRLRVEDDFPGPRLAAEAGGEIGHVADRRVFPALLEADDAEGRVALRDADAQAHLVAELLPGAGDRLESAL